MESHTGLRGISAVWIMVFHCFLFNRDLLLDFQGSTLMPLFFLLSGYALAIGYGGKKTGLGNNKISFYRNRFARVYPTYMVGNLVALPLWFYGFGLVPSSRVWGFGVFGGIANNLALSIIPISSLICSLPIDAPGWTIATLAVMWLIFPFHLPSLQNKSNAQLLELIVRCYYIQLILGVVLFIVIIPFGGGYIAFSASTMNPISRYPIFLMGVCAGLLSLRQSAEDDNSDSSIDAKPLDYWPSSRVDLFPRLGCCSTQTNKIGDDSCSTIDRGIYWVNRTYSLSLYIFLLTVTISILDAIARYAFGSSAGLLGNWWLQLVVPFVQLEILIGLVLETKTESTVRRILTSQVAQYLGKMSMSLYLIHWVVIYYVCLTLNGFDILDWPYDSLDKITHSQCEDDYGEDDGLESACKDDVDDFDRKRLIPMWSIPLVIAISFALSVALYYAVECPGRNLLKTKKKSSSSLLPESGVVLSAGP